MADQLEIYNGALTELGADLLSDVTEDTNAQRALTAQWDRVRKAELRAHGWKCAKARENLPADATAPAFGFAYAYTLPADFLRVWRLGELADRIEYQTEGGKILTDASGPLELIYVRDLTDVALWDASLADALTFRLAYATCYRITGSNDLRDQLGKDYKRAITLARTVSAMEAFPDTLEASDYLDVRL